MLKLLARSERNKRPGVSVETLDDFTRDSVRQVIYRMYREGWHYLCQQMTADCQGHHPGLSASPRHDWRGAPCPRLQVKMLLALHPSSSHSIGEGERVHFDCRVEPKMDPNLRIEWYLPCGHDMGFVFLDILYTYAEDSGESTI
uniref:Ig-like domain-containing protein n=1 Tax=Timema monikensis TaxID=170555 RepID=A0A7R9E6Q3_9NEOP|nr:unnamed protein product [Timema monikensis]